MFLNIFFKKRGKIYLCMFLNLIKNALSPFWLWRIPSSTRSVQDPSGYMGLPELLDHGQNALASVREHDRRCQSALEGRVLSNLDGCIVVTTSYSGLGTAEIAGSQIAAAFKKRVVNFSAADHAKGPLQVLLHGHAEDTKPLHVFGNILFRLPKSVRSEVMQLQKQKMKEYSDVEKSHGKAHKRCKFAKRRLGVELRDGICRLLQNCEFEQEAYCHRHRQKCPINPRLMPEYENAIWVEVAGSECKPWTQMGGQGDWLHATTATCLTWVYWNKFFAPDVLLHECTPRFQASQLLRMLQPSSKRTRIPDPCTVFGRTTIRCEKRVWQSESFLLCPTHFGWPSRRLRKYTFLWQPGVVQSLPFDLLDFFQRPLKDNADIFVVADSDQLHDRAKIMAHAQGIVCEEEELDCIPLSAFLTPAKWVRLQQYERELLPTLPDVEALPCALVNLSQCQHFFKGCDTAVVPPLLCGSDVFCIKRQRSVEVFPECFVIMGFGVDIEVLPRERVHLLIGKLRSRGKITENQCRTLCGNAMHVSVVTACMAVLLGMKLCQPEQH